MATITVLNTNDSGAGSLRQAIADAASGDTVTFDPSLVGETITLNAGLGPRNEVTIVGLVDDDGKPAISIDGNGKYVFSADCPIHVSNIAFNGGKGAFASVGGYDGSTFENCTFENMNSRVFELFTESPTSESVEFTNCVFRNNDAYDIWIDGMVNVILSGGNVLTEGFNFTAAEPLVITNANYNGVGGYSAPSGGTASVAGSGHIALPGAATITIAQTVTRSEFGAGVSAISTSGSEISWTATDSTKSVLLEKQNGASWNAVDDDATSPATVSAAGTYRVWDGVAFFSTSVEPEPEPEPPEPVAVRPGKIAAKRVQYVYTNNSDTAIPPGAGVKMGAAAFGVAVYGIEPGGRGVLAAYGVFNLPCADDLTAAAGDLAYWDDENKKVKASGGGSDIPATKNYTAIYEGGQTMIFTVADTTGWQIGDIIHVDGDTVPLTITSVTATTVTVSGRTEILADDTGTLVFDSRPGAGAAALKIGVFSAAVTAGETEAEIVVFPAAQ